MEGFAMLLGHMCGDYLLQWDYLAKNKTNPWPGPRPGTTRLPDGSLVVSDDLGRRLAMWDGGMTLWRVGHVTCTIHCVLYAFSCWLFCWAWMPWWAALVVAVVHWPIDRFKVARRWMDRISFQKEFAAGPLSPWSVVVVDNLFHLLTLYGVRLLCKWVTP